MAQSADPPDVEQSQKYRVITKKVPSNNKKVPGNKKKVPGNNKKVPGNNKKVPGNNNNEYSKPFGEN